MQSKKRRYRKKYPGVKKIPALIMALVLLAAGYTNLDGLMSLLDNGDTVIENTIAEGEMKATFLDVGQGDCMVIQTEDHNAVIDVGNNDKGIQVVDFLEKSGIESLDYLILTHPDADHIGGADNILESVQVKKVIMPDVSNDTMTYEEVIEDIKTYDIEVVHPSVGDTFSMGDAEFTVLCPEEELVGEEDTNNVSIGMKLVHGEKSFVMCGDAEEKSEEAMVKRFGSSLECDVLKCGHHGSSTATTDAFLKETNPTWAVISCGKDNSYGHPHREVLSKLEEDDVQILRTDTMGMITAVSDGKNITIQ